MNPSTLVNLARRVTLLALAAVMVLTGATAASAQSSAQRPSGGLFGGGNGDPGGRHSVDFSISLIGAHDSDSRAEVLPTSVSDAALNGVSTMLLGEGQYGWRGSRVQIGASGASSLRYYGQLDAIRTVSHTGGVGLSARLGGRTTIFGNQTVTYSPSYLFDLFPHQEEDSPGESVPVAPDHAIDEATAYSYGTRVSLTHGLSRRSRFSVSGDLTYTDFLHEGETRRDLRSHWVSGTYSRNLARNTALRLTYRYTSGEYGRSDDDEELAVSTAVEHGVDAGVNYSRPLSATRQMTLSFGLGGSTAERPSTREIESDSRRLIRLSANAAFGYEFSRSWQARARYRRGMKYVVALTEPVFTDAFSAEIRGLLSPRVDVGATARYSTGAAGLRSNGRRFDAYGGGLRIRYGLTRSLAAYGEYVYYFYDLQRTATLAPDIPSNLERNAIRAGLTLWLPALRR